MPNPQQPELRRSGHTPADQDHAAEVAGGVPAAAGTNAPVPEDNRPGHHPAKEQDKPDLGDGRRRAGDTEPGDASDAKGAAR